MQRKSSIFVVLLKFNSAFIDEGLVRKLPQAVFKDVTNDWCALMRVALPVEATHELQNMQKIVIPAKLSKSESAPNELKIAGNLL